MVRFAAGAAALILALHAAAGSARAADQSIPHRFHATSHRTVPYARDCGCCGCWYPEFVRHRQILYSYPSDPRYTLTSEPSYVPGPRRLSLHNLF